MFCLTSVVFKSYFACIYFSSFGFGFKTPGIPNLGIKWFAQRIRNNYDHFSICHVKNIILYGKRSNKLACLLLLACLYFFLIFNGNSRKLNFRSYKNRSVIYFLSQFLVLCAHLLHVLLERIH